MNKTEVERYSVNNVMLDNDPQEPSERLLVCCSVTSNDHGYTLRNTTLMPQISGFGSIMAALFAPIVQVHRDATKTRYRSFLCGLGFKSIGSNYVACFPEHDLAINCDVAFDTEDMQTLNKIRYFMSVLLYIMPGEQAPNLTEDKILMIRRDIKLSLMSFLSRKRYTTDSYPESDDYDWNAVNKSELLECHDVYKDKAIFPMFKFMKLTPETNADVKKFRDNNQLLHAIAFA